ncbi:filamentous hemagglutinin, partial [Bartonella silvatica]
EKNLIKAAIGTGVQTALEGGSFDKNFFNNLRIALSDTVGKSLAEEIGTAKAEGKIDTVTQIVAHAGLGCLKGAVASGACSAGAIGGAVGEATAMLQFQLWSKNLIQKEIAALNGRIPTAEEQARINAKIEAQFSDFNDHAIDVARAAGGFAAALAGGDVNTGADAAGNAAENNFLPAVAALAAFIVSLTPEELAALSLFMAGGATVVGSSSNGTAITDFLGYLFASKNAEEDSEKTNQNSQEEKNKDSQKESKNKKKNGNNKEPQNNNDGKGNILAQVRKHHDKKRDEKIQELRDEGCIVCETEIVFKTKTDKGVVRSRADIVGIRKGKLFVGDVKTGKAGLSGNQKILKEAYKKGNSESTKGKIINFFKENKEFLEKYQESFKGFKGSDKKLNEASEKWIKEQLSNKLDKMDFYTFHYPGLFE